MGSNIAANILDAIGGTPIVRLQQFGAGLAPALHAKIESMNPAGSMKDRSALRMIEAAEAEHQLRPGAKIVIATSGNMGVGMAMVCAVKKFQLICLVDPKIPPATERCLETLGAKLVKVYKRDHTGGYHLTRLEKVEDVLTENPDAVYLDQYDSAANIDAHYSSTGPEILEGVGGQLAAIVMVAGTGGSSMGVARYFRQHAPDTDFWLVDEHGSLALAGNDGSAPRFLNGMGTSIEPANYGGEGFRDYVDHVVYVDAAQAIDAAAQLARTEGILTGGTGGAALHVMRNVAAAHYGPGDRLLALLPDHGSRYMDTQFNKDWLTLQNIYVPTIYDDASEAD
jgi:cysteine synthase